MYFVSLNSGAEISERDRVATIGFWLTPGTGSSPGASLADGGGLRI